MTTTDGDILRRWREANGLSMSRSERLTGRYPSDLESGKTIPAPTTWARLLAMYGCDLGDLRHICPNADRERGGFVVNEIGRVTTAPASRFVARALGCSIKRAGKKLYAENRARITPGDMSRIFALLPNAPENPMLDWLRLFLYDGYATCDRKDRTQPAVYQSGARIADAIGCPRPHISEQGDVFVLTVATPFDEPIREAQADHDTAAT